MYSKTKPTLFSVNRSIKSVTDWLVTGNLTKGGLESRAFEAKEILDFFTHNKVAMEEAMRFLVTMLGYLSFDERDKLMVEIRQVHDLLSSLKDEMGNDNVINMLIFHGLSVMFNKSIINMRQDHLKEMVAEPLQQLAIKYPSTQSAIKNLLNQIESVKNELLEADQFPWTAMEYFFRDITNLSKAVAQQETSTYNFVTAINNTGKKWGLRRQENTFIKAIVNFFRKLFHIANAKLQKATTPFCGSYAAETFTPISSHHICAAYVA